MSQNISTKCKNCNNYLFISINQDKLNEILIQCGDCGYEKNHLIHNYLQMKNILHYNEKKENYCNIHCQNYSYYCINCKKYLCHQCDTSNHFSHELVLLDNIISINNLVS